jgi:hypothetical protein
MLEGYKPIDFSGVFPPVDLGQVRNKVGLSQAAIGILANSQFSQTPISSLLGQGLTSKGEVPKRKQTLFGRAVDLLSTPSYLVANATDDAIAGHQSHDSDSILADIGQVIGGVVTGTGRGIGTGFRGAFAGSETAADPQDKIYLGDSLIRLDTHMSAEEAKKPENLEAVRSKLMGKKINQFDDSDENKYFYDFDKKKVEVTDDDIEDYFKHMGVYGVAASAVSDPLNFVKGPTGILSGVKGAAEVPEAATAVNKASDVLAPLNTGTGISSVDLSALGKKPNGSYKVSFPTGAVQNAVAAPSSITPIVPKALELNQVDPLDSILGGWSAGSKTIDKVGDSLAPVGKVPDEQIAIANKLSAPDAIGKLTGDLLRKAATGEMSGLIGHLANKYPGVDFSQTSKLVEHIAKIPDFAKRLGSPVERKKIVGAFHRTIRADAEAMKIAPPVKSAGTLINDASKVDPVNLQRLVQGAKPGQIVSKNPVRDTAMADATVAKFEGQILGNQYPAGIRDKVAYDRSVSAGRTARYSGSQQVQMWNHITHIMKDIKSPNRFAVANNILRKVEDSFIAKGAKPVNGVRTVDSVPLRLSQVLDAIGPAAAAMNPTLLTKILRGDPTALKGLPTEVIQRIEAFKAGEALVDSSSVVAGVNAASKNIDDITKGPLSAGRTDEAVTIGSRVAQDITRAAGGSPVAGNQAAKYIKDSYAPKSPIDSAIRAAHINTTALISHPSVGASQIMRYGNGPAITRAINKVIGGPRLAVLGTKVGEPAAVVEWLGARFNAAYKNADMRPIYLKQAATAKSTVARRAQYLNNLAKQFNVNDLDLWNGALKGAQGLQEPIVGSPEALLSREILTVMENLFGSSGLKSSVALENSVVGRSQLFMDELNKNLRRFGLGDYQFTKKGKYKTGTEWLNSWESWDVKRPMEFLFKMQNVVEHTTREKLMFDEIAGRFGNYTRSGVFTHTVSHPRLAGAYFGKEAAEQINQFTRNLKDIAKPNSKQMQMFDKVLSKWKAGVTIYVPSHHIRNMIGDVYFNWLGGVNSTRAYGTAFKVMQSQRGRYEGLAELDNLTNPKAIQRAMSGSSSNAVGKQTALTMRNGTHVTNDMVYVSAFQHGILPSTRVLEDIPDDVASGIDKFRPLGGRAQKAAHTLSEGRDHYVRLAHYVDVLKKSGKSFEAATEEAAGVVRKWHPDGMDLTKFERNVVRRMFPFYSWTRKALPLIIESLVATPGKVMAYPKAEYLLQQMMGIQTGPMSDPFPYDQLFPDWIREKGIGPTMGGPGDYTVANPSNPTLDLIAQLNHPGRMGMGMLNPAARIPIELSTGVDAQTGAPIDGLDPDYIAKQIPGVSHVGRISGEFGVSDTTKENSSGFNAQNIFNLLTALNVQNTGPYQKSAEFDMRDYLKQQRG